MARSYTMSPAAKAARAETIKKAREAKFTIDNYVQKVVANAGELTPEHIERLRALLPPVSRDEGGRAA